MSHSKRRVKHSVPFSLLSPRQCISLIVLFAYRVIIIIIIIIIAFVSRRNRSRRSHKTIFIFTLYYTLYVVQRHGTQSFHTPPMHVCHFYSISASLTLCISISLFPSRYITHAPPPVFIVTLCLYRPNEGRHQSTPPPHSHSYVRPTSVRNSRPKANTAAAPSHPPLDQKERSGSSRRHTGTGKRKSMPRSPTVILMQRIYQTYPAAPKCWAQMEFVNIYQFRFHPVLKYACVVFIVFGLYYLRHCGKPWRWLVAAYRPC